MGNSKKVVAEIDGILANNLNRLLNEQNKTTGDVARACNVTTAAILNYVNKKQLPNAKVLVAIAKYLNCSTDFLVGINDNPSPKENYKVLAKQFGLTDDAIATLEQGANAKSNDMTNYKTGDEIYNKLRSNDCQSVTEFINLFTAYKNNCNNNYAIKILWEILNYIKWDIENDAKIKVDGHYGYITGAEWKAAKLFNIQKNLDKFRVNYQRELKQPESPTEKGAK